MRLPPSEAFRFQLEGIGGRSRNRTNFAALITQKCLILLEISTKFAFLTLLVCDPMVLGSGSPWGPAEPGQEFVSVRFIAHGKGFRTDGEPATLRVNQHGLALSTSEPRFLSGRLSPSPKIRPQKRPRSANRAIHTE